MRFCFFFFFQAEDGIRDLYVTGVQTCALPIYTIPGTVFVTGDNVGSPGDSATYANCYNPTWGRHKTRTFPVPGDAEYATAGAAGYYGYFGAAAGDPTKGYYSYDLGAWHVIALNSATSM